MKAYPPKPLEDGLTDAHGEFTRACITFPIRRDGPVSGDGPYRAIRRSIYFQQRATTSCTARLGMPNIVTLDSLQQMMPESAPCGRRADDWGMHDFTSPGRRRASFAR